MYHANDQISTIKIGSIQPIFTFIYFFISIISSFIPDIRARLETEEVEEHCEITPLF